MVLECIDQHRVNLYKKKREMIAWDDNFVSTYPMRSTAHSTWCSLNARITNTCWRKKTSTNFHKSSERLPTLRHCVYQTHLNVHFYDGFSNERSTKKCPEWYQEMTACYSSKVKERVRNLKAQIYTSDELVVAGDGCINRYIPTHRSTE